MPNLENRISALERVTCPNSAITIIRRIITPGHVGAQIKQISDNDGNEWTRQISESEDQFIDNADRETRPNEWRCKSLTATTL
jgi:hypothetical protein